jgi:signal transduction histidine kinase
VQVFPEDCAIQALVAEVCERQQDISPQHRIVVDIDRLPSSIVADPKAIDQVFTNLVSNAVKYSPEGGQIDVIGRVDGDHIEVAVHDSGLGIPADELPQLFERFFRARTSTGIVGTGIGLHLVKQLVEMHGGTIGVNSIEGEGSTFIVTVPLGAGPSSEDIVDSENHNTATATMEIFAPGGIS